MHPIRSQSVRAELPAPPCRSAVVQVAGLSAPLLVEGSIADVEDAVAALGKVAVQHASTLMFTAI